MWLHKGKTIVGANSIEHRPDEVSERDIIGHWETDNVIGKALDTSCLSTTVERVIRYTVLTKLPNKGAKSKREALVGRLKRYPTQIRRSITADNGTENADHWWVSKRLRMPMYFCHAYASWEKGTNENTNGRLRRYIPKGASIDRLTVEQIAEVETLLNNTPSITTRLFRVY